MLWYVVTIDCVKFLVRFHDCYMVRLANTGTEVLGLSTLYISDVKWWLDDDMYILAELVFDEYNSL